jgi:hypothetical protein
MCFSYVAAALAAAYFAKQNSEKSIQFGSFRAKNSIVF